MRDRSAPLTVSEIGELAWEKMGGLIPALVQDRVSGEVLMLAYVNPEALEATLGTGFATFFSRSKQRLWKKGETSGNRLKLHAVFTDCDGDALLLLVDPEGPVCHLGTRSCFEADLAGPGWLAQLSAIIAERAASDDAVELHAQAARPGHRAHRAEDRRRGDRSRSGGGNARIQPDARRKSRTSSITSAC